MDANAKKVRRQRKEDSAAIKGDRRNSGTVLQFHIRGTDKTVPEFPVQRSWNGQKKSEN